MKDPGKPTPHLTEGRTLDPGELTAARAGYHTFVMCTRAADGFRLTPRAEPSPYARCFGLYGLSLVGRRADLASGADGWARQIREDLDHVRARRRAAGADLHVDKTYLQLLTFSLSALRVLDRLDDDPLEDHVVPLLSADILADLERAGVFEGAAQSGNYAMFLAILLLHGRDALARDSDQIARWCSLHLERMNQFGFWGPAGSMSHLQFQNGYHQYEILEYLGVPVPSWPEVADHVAALADDEGHFAPYPGGGGCYDYDAVFMLTGAGSAAVAQHRELLLRTARSILDEQNADGGFGESQRIRPRSIHNVRRAFDHWRAGRGAARRERLRHGLTLLRHRHDRIRTHWSKYSREWGESNLWDSWFRMLTLARIDAALDPTRAAMSGFVDFPGIGHHYSLRVPGSR